ncbi:MAG: hypothetical protein ABUT20_08370, partial [Bacteroidota bacterium]
MIYISLKKTLSLFVIIITVLITSCRVSNKTSSGNQDKSTLIYNVNIINVRDGSIANNKAILIK